MIDLATVSPSLFETAIGELFALDGDEALTLIAIQRLQSPSPRTEPFSALFTHPSRSLPQGTYTLRHERLGSLTLFVVPIQPDARGRLHEVVFN